MSFNYKEFLKEGGIEKYLLEEQFGNDIESRYNFVRPLMSRLPDSARTEAMIDGMEEAKAEDDKMAFDFYFVETMKMLGLEDSLMEPDEIGGEVDEISPEDLEAASDYFDNLEENDDVLDEMLDEGKFEVGDMVRYYSQSTHEAYIGIISDPDTITWFCDGVKEAVSNYEEFPLEVISKKQDPRQLKLDF